MPGKKTLLIVEDEEPIRLSVQRILELSENYEVITAVNGKDGLKKVAGTIPDLIISDIAMPEMDGIEFCKKIRENETTRSIPFIFLTAKRERLLEGIQTGSDDYLIKPFQVDELIAKIKALFRRIDSTRDQARLQKGNLSEYSVDEILQICAAQAFSGELIVRHDQQECVIMLSRGEIGHIRLEGYDEDQALDEVRQWKEGTFVLKPQEWNIKSRKSVQASTFRSETVDISKAVQIAEDTWWVGYRNPESLLQINVYLRQFRKNGKSVNYLIDPGSPVDFPVISQKVSELIGDMANLNVYSINHQDPDVAMNAVFIKNINPRAICITSEDNWRLVSHYEINPRSVKLIDDFKDFSVKFATGHELIYVPSPYCHFKGAFLTYDPQTRVLFTGDLFAGISRSENINSLWAGEEEWDGIVAFHQLYMPTNKALRHTIDAIRRIKPEPIMIAPQHGGIIQIDLLDTFLERMYNLKVGADLLVSSIDSRTQALVCSAANDIIVYAIKTMGQDKVAEKLGHDSELTSMAKIDGSGVSQIFHDGELLIQKLCHTLSRGEAPSLITQIKSVALKSAVTRNLPAPSLDWEGDETGNMAPEDIFGG